MEELLFRIEGSAVGEVGTIEGVETTELLFKTYAVVGPAEVVGTIEDVETIELLFRTEGVDMAEEDTELWTNRYADGEGAEDDAAAVVKMLLF